MNKYNNLSTEFASVTEWMKKEMKQISAGAVNPAVLDSVMVESYGSYMQIMHLASVSIDGNSLKVCAFDKTQNKPIEQAVRDADLGVSLVTESDGIRVIFPQLTTETRQKFVKIAKEKLEDARIKVRHFRSEAIDEIDQEKKDGLMGEDDAKRKKDDVQKKVDSTNAELEGMYKHKEEVILKV